MRVYGWVRRTGGVSWYRVQEKLRGLRLMGHTTGSGPDLNFATLNDWDVILTSVHGEAEASAGWEAMARLPNRPFMIYDIDDDVWNFREGLHQYKYWTDEELLRNVQSCITCADAVTSPSLVLMDIVSELNSNVHYVGNYVPEWLTLTAKRSPVDPFTVGYQGGDTHMYDIVQIGAQLLRFLINHTDIRLRVWGASSYDGVFAPERVTVTPWQRDINIYYSTLFMTIGLAPLERIPFNDAKSAIKAVEYAAFGIPCIASNLHTYRDTVIPEETGFLVEPDEWYDALLTLYRDPSLVMRMGAAARSRAVEWTTEYNAPFYSKLLEGLLHG